MADVYLWRPAKTELEGLEFCMGNGSRQDIREALLESLDTSTRPLTAENADTTSPKSLPEAIERLQAEWQRPSGTDDQEKKRWQDFERMVEQELVTPLLREISTTTSPTRISLPT